MSAGKPGTAVSCVSCVFMVAESPGQESSTGRPEPALGCPTQCGVTRNGGSVVRPGWLLLSSQPLKRPWVQVSGKLCEEAPGPWEALLIDTCWLL